MQERNYCVYKHTSPSNKVYIGITSMKPIKRWNNGRGYIQHRSFYRAIQKYGWENIKHEILFENLSKEEACQKEIELISFYKSNQRGFGYNLSSGGESGSKGCHHSEEAKRKNAEAHKGQIPWNKGKHLSEETKNKLSLIMKGKKMSEEFCKKISEAKKGENHHMFGKTHTEEARKKISKNSATPKVAIAYKEYKANGGTLKWNEFQKTFKQVK